MPAAEIARQINTILRNLRPAIFAEDDARVSRMLVLLNELDPTMQFMVRDRRVCVRLVGGRTTAPIGVMHAADYVERLDFNGSVEVLKDRSGGHEVVAPDWPDFPKSEPLSAWDHLMADDGS